MKENKIIIKGTKFQKVLLGVSLLIVIALLVFLIVSKANNLNYEIVEKVLTYSLLVQFVLMTIIISQNKEDKEDKEDKENKKDNK